MSCNENFLGISLMKHVVFLSEACLKDERLMIFCSKELQRLPLMCTLRKSFSITEILARFGVYVKKFLPIGLYGHTPHKNYILGFLLFYEILHFALYKIVYFWEQIYVNCKTKSNHWQA